LSFSHFTTSDSSSFGLFAVAKISIAFIIACAFVNLFVDQNLLDKRLCTHATSAIFLTDHHAITHVPSQAGINNICAHLNLTLISLSIVQFFNGSIFIFFLALTIAFLIAIVTSFAFQIPSHTFHFSFHATTVALNLILLHHLTTRVTLARSINSSLNSL